jgi:hypothetical protein
MKTTKIEDVAWDIYINGMKSKWVSDRVTNRDNFKDCDEYDEHMEMARDVIKHISTIKKHNED